MSRNDSQGLGTLISIAEEAAEWLLTLKEQGLPRADKERFIAWLKRSPVHVQEFLRISSLDSELAGRPLGFDADALVAQCHGSSRVEELPIPRLAPAAARTRFWSPLRLAAAVAAVTVATVAAIVFVQRPDGEYVTSRGEQRVVSLADGSLMELNTKTRLQVDYDAATRRIRLSEGEALFVVARNPNRPFIVEAGGQSIRATGTRFNVSARTERTVVTVIEGSVIVGEPAKPAASQALQGGPEPALANEREATPLKAGEQLVVALGQTSSKVERADAARAIAWQEWKLYFDEDSLAAAAAEFNRYNRQQIAIDDAELAQRRISGVFFANQPDSLLAFIASRDAVEVVREDKERRTIRLRKNSSRTGPAP